MKLNHTSSGPLSRENSVINMPPVFILYENKWQLVDMGLIVLHQRGDGGAEELVVAWQHSQFSWTAVLDRWLNKHGFSSGGGMGAGGLLLPCFHSLLLVLSIILTKKVSQVLSKQRSGEPSAPAPGRVTG